MSNLEMINHNLEGQLNSAKKIDPAEIKKVEIFLNKMEGNKETTIENQSLHSFKTYLNQLEESLKQKKSNLRCRGGSPFLSNCQKGGIISWYKRTTSKETNWNSTKISKPAKKE